nr:FCD domain-containing protein [Brenneria goodwinii]
MRAVIEQAAFRFACLRASDEDINQTAEIWEQSCRDLPDPETITDWTKVAEDDEAFHMSIARIARNGRLYDTLGSLNSLIRFFRRIDLETPSRRNNAYDEHIGIIEALRQRDVERGVLLMEKHVSLSAEHAVAVTKEGLARIYFGKLT